MRELEYPSFLDHHQLHVQLVKDANKTLSEARKTGERELGLRFLRNWWLKHINGADREFGLFVKKADKLIAQNMYFPWKHTYNLGIPIIDEQHRGLVVIINAYHNALSDDFYDNEKLMIFKTLSDQYIGIHFRTEEKLMKEVEYPGLMDHRQLHQDLTKESEKRAKEFLQTGDREMPLIFLKEWWLKHENDADLDFSLFLKRMK